MWGGGGPVEAAPHRGRRRGSARSCHVEEESVGGGGWRPTVCGRATPTANRQRQVWVGVATRGSKGRKGGSDWGGHGWAVGVGRPKAHSAVLQLSKDFQIKSNFKRSKAGLMLP
jgi:hypothetical protein